MQKKIDILRRDLSTDITHYNRQLWLHRRDQVTHQWVQLLGAFSIAVSLGINFKYSREIAIVLSALISMSKAIELMVNFNRKIKALFLFCHGLSTIEKELEYCMAASFVDDEVQLSSRIDDLHSRYISLSNQFNTEWNTYGTKHEKSV